MVHRKTQDARGIKNFIVLGNMFIVLKNSYNILQYLFLFQAILHTRKRIQSTSDDLLRQLDSRINSASSNNTTPANQDKPRSRLSKLHKRYTSYGTIGRKSASKLPPPASPSTVVKDDAATRFSFESCSNNFSPGFRCV